MQMLISQTARHFLSPGMAMLKPSRLQAESNNCDCWKWAAIAALALQMTAGAAEPIVQWVTVAGGPGRDYCSGIALAPAGELYLVGDFEQELNGRWDRPTKVLYKFDLSGTLISSQASRGEAIRAVAVDAQGNYYLTGFVWDGDRIDANVFHVAKYSSTGTLLWERNAGTPTNSTAHSSGGSSIALDAAGHVYVAGGSSGPEIFGGTMFPDTAGGPLLCKYELDGTLLWAKRAETGGGGIGSIALDANGDIVATGFGFIAKYSPEGEVKWAKEIPVFASVAVAVDGHGNIFCTGDAMNGMYCAKLAANGSPLWEKVIPNAYPSGLALDGKDEPIFTAVFLKTVRLGDLVVQHSSTEYDLLVCKADAAGTFQWALVGRGSAHTGNGKVVCDRIGNAYVAGTIGGGIINGVWVSYEGMLGSSPLNMLFPGDDNSARDVFVARLTDPNAVAVELSIARTASGLALSWPVSATGFNLEVSESLAPESSWTAVTAAPVVVGEQNVVSVEAGGGAKFYRLRKP